MRSTIFLAGVSAVQAYTVVNHETFMNKNVDAIVKPGEYTSHLHTFFGSDAITNVMPTSAQLQKGCYSGTNGNDRSAYWIPTLLYVNGSDYVPVPIYRFSTYYENSIYADGPIPQDIGYIAGNASAINQAGADHPYNLLNWWCEDDAEEDKDLGKFPTKTCSTHLKTILRFPDCVKTDTLNAFDYSGKRYTTNRCPEGYMRIPQLRISVRYDLRKIIPDGWSGTAPLQLSCSDTPGDGYCMHGDFTNGWFPDAAENMLKVDSEGKQHFQYLTGKNDATGQTRSECEPKDADPFNGTSDFLTSVEMKENGGKLVNATAAAVDSVKRTIGSKSKRAAARRA